MTWRVGVFAGLAAVVLVVLYIRRRNQDVATTPAANRRPVTTANHVKSIISTLSPALLS